MTTLVTRLYADRSRAEAAARSLQALGYGKRLVTIVPGGGDGAAAKAALKAAGVAGSSVGPYAEKLVGGASLVVAKAPTGSYFEVRDTLDEAGPLPSPVKTADAHVYSRESSATPKKRHTPVLLGDGNRSILSQGWMVPLMDFAWGSFSKDRPRSKYISDFAWGSFSPDRPRSKYISDFAWGSFGPDRPRWKYLSDRGWGGAR
jgi:hypothetical protein